MDIFEAQAGWMAQRLGKFTASEVHKLLKAGKAKGKIFGDTALTYINEKVAEIITGESKPQINGRAAMEHGSAHEHEALLFFEQLTGFKVEYFGGANPRFFPFNAYSGASPDGLHEVFLYEGKCPYCSDVHVDYLLMSREEDHNAALLAYNPEYYAQVQFGMMCTGKKLAFFTSYDPRTIEPSHRMAILRIKEDPDFQANLKTRLELAAGIVNSKLSLLDTQPVIPDTESILLVHADPDGVVIINKEQELKQL